LSFRITIVSDIHYAAAAEKSLGNDYELRGIQNPLTRLFIRFYRRFIWLHNSLNQSHLLDKFLDAAPQSDLVIANGDYSCDCASLGLSDDGTFQSVEECLTKLRKKFDPALRLTIGDHELGKVSFFGHRGGMRVESWRRLAKLGLDPFWRFEIGKYVIFGITSSLVALPIFEPDTLSDERSEWEKLRATHLAQIRSAFASLKPDQRVLLFSHDPTALPFLSRDEIIGPKIPQIEQTIIGHLHSNLVLWKGRLLAGIPPVNFLGHSIKRFSRALREARAWRAFHVRLCPALAGIELLKDGGYLTVDLDPDAGRPAAFQFHPIQR
jgi:Calcineurin-like phosphoesterase